MPEHTRIALVREDIAICKQLVIDDGTPLVAQIVVFHKGDRGLRLLLQNGFPGGEIPQTEPILITHCLEHFAHREIKGIHRITI